MSDYLSYKGYSGSINYNPIERTFFGMIRKQGWGYYPYEGKSLTELQIAFEIACDRSEEDL
jgi:predicted HicB family RNase H-like nuclease